MRVFPDYAVKTSSQTPGRLTYKTVFLTLLLRGHVRGYILKADIAQLVEQRIRNAKVGGSTPLIGTNVFNTLSSFQINHVLLLCHICDITANNRIDFARMLTQMPGR